MTLKEWAQREGLEHLYGDYAETTRFSIEQDVSEVVVEPSHCWDCAVWYVRRDRAGQLFRTGPDGSDSTGTRISEDELFLTTRKYWEHG